VVRTEPATVVSAYIFIGCVVIAVFAWDAFRQWWRHNEWRRRWRNRDEE
jgi:hypothetical protein